MNYQYFFFQKTHIIMAGFPLQFEGGRLATRHQLNVAQSIRYLEIPCDQPLGYHCDTLYYHCDTYMVSAALTIQLVVTYSQHKN